MIQIKKNSEAFVIVRPQVRSDQIYDLYRQILPESDSKDRLQVKFLPENRP